MVRFIIIYNLIKQSLFQSIYIPIWLDLLSVLLISGLNNIPSFTFQYGQIYYNSVCASVFAILAIYIPIWLDLLYGRSNFGNIERSYLHSNMVRFIMRYCVLRYEVMFLFTFQYGQIYYVVILACPRLRSNIYIPIWLDLLFRNLDKDIYRFLSFTFQYGQIYYKQDKQVY